MWRLLERKMEFYKGDEIRKAINEVIVEKSGEGMRRRAEKLGEKRK